MDATTTLKSLFSENLYNYVFPKEQNNSLKVAKLVCIAVGAVFAMHAATALLTLSPIKASFLLGCTYLSYETSLIVQEISPSTIEGDASITVKDLLRWTKKAPVLHTFFEILAQNLPSK